MSTRTAPPPSVAASDSLWTDLASELDTSTWRVSGGHSAACGLGSWPLQQWGAPAPGAAGGAAPLPTQLAPFAASLLLAGQHRASCHAL